MPTNLAINGFGRIGRLVLRTVLERYKTDLNVIAINDMADLKTNAHLFRYDSTYGMYSGQIETRDGAMMVDGGKSAYSTIRTLPVCPGNSWGSTSSLKRPAFLTTPPRCAPISTNGVTAATSPISQC